MDWQDIFSGFFDRAVGGISAARMAGENVEPYTCESRRELAAWFTGFAHACGRARECKEVE